MSLVNIQTDERKRFESFKLGGQAPPPTTGSRHGHARSHSRNSSVSASLSAFSFPAAAPPKSVLTELSSNKPSRPLSLPPMSVIPANPVSVLASNSKRNSHHRRRSSVSTRHESAELMGVSLPDLPLSTSDDNVNLGEKDSIRRRALWALEGKPDVSFAKVEIPDINTPDIEKMMFDFSNKPSLSNSVPSFGNTMGNKRDSFKLLAPSSSSKDQLGTLLEEEEEEEEDCVSSPCGPEEPVKAEDSLPSPVSSITEILPCADDEPVLLAPAVAVTQPTPSKPRPANLNLRPLSLTPDNLITAASGLPTPTLTPSPQSGLRTLSLATTSTSSDDESLTSSKQSRRRSLFLVASPTPCFKRPTLNLATTQMDNSGSPQPSEDPENRPTRRSSISYKRSSSGSVVSGVVVNAAGLPTPEMTPTYSRRYSITSDNGLSSTIMSPPEFTINEEDQSFQFFRAPQNQTQVQTQALSLSASEQHFLFKSHNALLARITDLERSLSMRRRESWSTSSRPISTASASPSSISDTEPQSDVLSGPSDEILSLVADLKSERDELKRDVEGWRQRVANLENQTMTLGKRVESERREAWIARSRVGLLEAEKQGLEGAMNRVEEKLRAMESEMETVSRAWVVEREKLTTENIMLSRKVDDLESRLEKTKKELDDARRAINEDSSATPTPGRSFEGLGVRPLRVEIPSGKKHGLGLLSVDSEASTTDVEPDSASEDGTHPTCFSLKTHQEESITEEDGDGDYLTEEEDEDNGLVGYEDEDEEIDNVSLRSSSFGSDQEMEWTRTPTTPKPNHDVHKPTHIKRASLSRTWTFPKAVSNQAPRQQEPVDHFFGCLEDDGTRPSASDTNSMPSSPSSYSYEKTKGLFVKAARAVIVDNASFFLPFGDNLTETEDTGSMNSSGSHLSLIDEEKDEELYDDEAEEEPEEGQEAVFGGIKFTFTPPQDDRFDESKEYEDSPTQKSSKRTSPPPMLPALDLGFDDLSFGDDDEEGDVFNFGKPLVFEHAKPTLVETRPVIEDIKAIVSFRAESSRSSIPRSTPPLARSISPSTAPSTSRTASPSSIPRSVSRPSISTDSSTSSPSQSPVPLSWSPTKIAMPLKPASSSSSSSQTAATLKRVGAPSAIPQPSPSRFVSRSSQSTTFKPKAPVVISAPTFIRQPTRKPLLPSGNTNGSTMIPQPTPIHFPVSGSPRSPMMSKVNVGNRQRR